MEESESSHVLLVEMQIGVATVEISLELPQKIKTRTAKVFPSEANLVTVFILLLFPSVKMTLTNKRLFFF